MNGGFSMAARPANYGMHLFYAALLVGGAVTVYLVGKNSTGGSAHTRLGIAGAALLLVGAYLLVRRVHPPRLRGLSLTVSPTEVRPGDTVAVAVDLRRGSPDGIQVGLVGT